MIYGLRLKKRKECESFVTIWEKHNLAPRIETNGKADRIKEF
jgi:hypothetical protein